MKQTCYIVMFSSYSEGSDAYAFWSEDYARRSIKDDANTEMKSLTEEGYEPVLLEHGEDQLTVYVPDSDIYFEWTLTPSTIE